MSQYVYLNIGRLLELLDFLKQLAIGVWRDKTHHGLLFWLKVKFKADLVPLLAICLNHYILV